ncbi:heme o synthase [Aciditerrimonas ferrireducens]|uniref:heme o synthase n=1 Tax=Aciditerrimonas ferrireducens TaxID=667306 RepID=UPI0020062A59|nr:heme o synthase [Aciditerrimonas ferrireducens]MCK4177558.1 heme o synthase [Aciditerrimonas ferrireducens]
MTSVSAAVGGSVPWRAKLRGYLALTKPRIVELLLVTTVPTMFVAKGGVPSVWLMLATVVGGSLAAGGANAVNMVVDQDIDRVMQRTKQRPLVTGVVTPRAALVFAVTLEVLAFVELTLAVNLLSAVLALAATAFYVFVYTLWLKRTSSQNIVIGGAAGAVPVLVGWAAVTGHLAWPPLLLFALIFLWTPPHFWALAIRYREDYRAVEVPMLPAVRSVPQVARQILAYTLALLVVTGLFAWDAHMGVLFGVVAGLDGLGFCWLAWRLLARPSTERAMAVFHASISYVTVLFAAMALDTVVRIHW